MSFRKFFCLSLLLLILGPVGLAEAKRGRREKVTVHGWGLSATGVDAPISTINTALNLEGFVDFERKVEPPANLAVAYTITRYRPSSDPKSGWKAVYRLSYYPDPAGGSGYVAYQGTLNGYWLYWPHGEGFFRVSRIGELAIRQILTKYNVLSSTWLTTKVPD